MAVTEKKQMVKRPNQFYLYQRTIMEMIIDNTRFVSFDIKFTRQGFENAC